MYPVTWAVNFEAGMKSIQHGKGYAHDRLRGGADGKRKRASGGNRRGPPTFKPEATLIPAAGGSDTREREASSRFDPSRQTPDRNAVQCSEPVT